MTNILKRIAVPLSRFTPRVGGGSAFFVRRLDIMQHNVIIAWLVLLVGCLGIIGCRSKPTLITNASDNLSDTQITNFTARASAGDVTASVRLAYYYGFIKCDRASELKWMEVAANQGDVSAQYNAGVLNEDADIKRAIYWFRLAASAGDANAKSRLIELKAQ